MQTNDISSGQTFQFKAKHKVIFGLLLLIGLGSLTWTFLHQSPEQFWSHLLLNNTLFLTLSLGAVIFVAAHIISKADWFLSVRRIAEASGMFLPIAAAFMVALLLFADNILPWIGKGHADPILEVKKPYLNLPFLIIRQVVILSVWVWLMIIIRRLSVKNDQQTDEHFIKRSRINSALFLVFTFLMIAVFSWDWMMSLEPHWFSTLYGWYILSGALLKGVAIIILVGGLLRSMGYLSYVNAEHLHDLGKYLFGFSVFWMYLWYSQFMLIWYGNIPEETIYYYNRMNQFEFLFILNVVLNFGLPFILLLDRGMRRRWVPLFLTALIILIGQWVDHYLLVVPGIVEKSVSVGIGEIGITIGYLGVFLWVVFYALSRANLLPVNHPNLKEGFHYENI